MVLRIDNTRIFEVKLKNNYRSSILKAKIEYLQKFNYSKEFIDACLLSNGYSVNELKSI